tara:strand:+ start:1037 stop:1618 length:582 start_codon:yes stop_codon:yes gene_type:complete
VRIAGLRGVGFFTVIVVRTAGLRGVGRFTVIVVRTLGLLTVIVVRTAGLRGVGRFTVMVVRTAGLRLLGGLTVIVVRIAGLRFLGELTVIVVRTAGFAFLAFLVTGLEVGALALVSAKAALDKHTQHKTLVRTDRSILCFFINENLLHERPLITTTLWVNVEYTFYHHSRSVKPCRRSLCAKNTEKNYDKTKG